MAKNREGRLTAIKLAVRSLVIGLLLSITSANAQTGPGQSGSDAFLGWNGKTLTKIGKLWRSKGKVGSRWTMRGINTSRAVNYKLRGTLMTPEMIRASARQHQLRYRLSNAKTRKLVADAEDAADLVVMVELDPNEGSGVIPREWRAVLQPKGLKLGMEGAIVGKSTPRLKKYPALGGVFRRNYNYDVFFVVFPLVDEDGNPLIADNVSALELVVGIYKREGRVSWPMPASLRQRMKSISEKRKESTDE